MVTGFIALVELSMKLFKGLFKLAIFCGICLIALIVGAVFLRGYGTYQDTAEETSIYDRVEAIREMEHFTTYDELPEIYVDAVVAVEDEDFFTHNGVDWKATGMAFLEDILTTDAVEEERTITQQLVKKEFFPKVEELEQRMAEVFAVKKLEEDYSKEDIFELYVNTISIGSGYYGIYEAAQGYYGKTPSELTDREAVALAGLTGVQTADSEKLSSKEEQKLVKQVVDRMKACNVISKEEAKQLLSEDN